MTTNEKAGTLLTNRLPIIYAVMDYCKRALGCFGIRQTIYDRGIIMEYLEGTALEPILPYITDDQAEAMKDKILETLAILHEQCLTAHRDPYAPNIMVLLSDDEIRDLQQNVGQATKELTEQGKLDDDDSVPNGLVSLEDAVRLIDFSRATFADEVSLETWQVRKRQDVAIVERLFGMARKDFRKEMREQALDLFM